MGVVSFVNELKDDARTTLATLTACDIATKIITGDNIFLAVQTAVETGMVSEKATVAVL